MLLNECKPSDFVSYRYRTVRLFLINPEAWARTVNEDKSRKSHEDPIYPYDKDERFEEILEDPREWDCPQ
jgi:hypothetical protein